MTGSVDCAIVGGGPAGMVLGLLLVRAGLRVTVLESQPDFDRDFRGDTVHASTLEMLDQISLAEKALAIPHSKLRRLSLNTPEKTLQLVDLGVLRSRFPYVAIMPQADFLEFLCTEAERYPGFRCLRGAAVHQLLEEEGRVAGVRYRQEGEDSALKASLTVAADGRFSRLRRLSGMEAVERAAPMDVCWFRLERLHSDGHDSGAFFISGGRMLIFIPRGGQWQLGYVFPKGNFNEVKAAGIDAFRDSLVATAPWLSDRVRALDDFSQVHLLNVKADCLKCWHRPGLLFIGDAAHVMSPVGGVGINIAIADAIEAANLLAHPDTPLLAEGPPQEGVLARFEARRKRPVRIVQASQSRMQELIVARALTDTPFDLPPLVKLLIRTPGLRQLPLRVLALGVSRSRLAV